MMKKEKNESWKLKIRYGKLKTPFHHFSVIGEGIVKKLKQGFSCPPGEAFMSLKVWASSEDEAMDMIVDIGEQIGFEVTKKIYVYKTEPTEPPKEKPYGYNITFNPFTKQKKKKSEK